MCYVALLRHFIPHIRRVCLQTTIGDIQTQMEAHSKRNDRLQEDNKELSSKLSSLLEQYEKREEVTTS